MRIMLTNTMNPFLSMSLRHCGKSITGIHCLSVLISIRYLSAGKFRSIENV